MFSTRLKIAVAAIAFGRRIRRARADAGRVLQGQAGLALYRLLGRRHLRSLRPHRGAPHRQAHPRQSGGGAEEHGRRRLDPAHQFHVCAGAEGRHRARDHGARRRVRPAVRHEGRAVRRREIRLARQRQRRSQPVRVVASLRRQELRRRASARADHRRDRPRRREPDRAEAAQRRARLEVQGDRRLSRLERDDDFDRAWRDAGTLRVLMGEHEERAPPVARREEAQHPGAALLPEASRAPARAARRRSRQDRGGEADDQSVGGETSDGPAVLHHARRAGRPHRGAAQGVPRHAQGSGVPGRGRKAQA